MKNILLLTDFSSNALKAIHYALQFFKDKKCLFYVMHVHKMGSFTSDDLMLSASRNNIYDSIVAQPKAQLNSLIEDLSSKFTNSHHEFKSVVDFDDFTDAINQIIKAKRIELIVLGTNGKTGAKEVIFGSNTLNVIRKVNCTTLIIPEDYKYKSVKNVLLALNTNDSLHEKPKQKLHKLMDEYSLNLNVLRINPDSVHPEFELFDKSNLEDFNYNYYTITNVPLQHAINSFIQLNTVDLSIAFAKKEGFFDRLFKGSAVSKLNNYLRLPLLILHND